METFDGSVMYLFVFMILMFYLRVTKKSSIRKKSRKKLLKKKSRKGKRRSNKKTSKNKKVYERKTKTVYPSHKNNIPKKKLSRSKEKELKKIGTDGEDKIAEVLYSLPGRGRFIRNLYLPHSRFKTRTTEIDIVYVNRYGIFVIESKNYSGKININEKEDMWKCTTNGRNFFFYSPIKQNMAHIKAIQSILPDDLEIFSIIVFKDNSLENVQLCKHIDTSVIERWELCDTIESYEYRKVLSRSKVREVSKLLNKHNMSSINVRHKHKKTLKQLYG